MAVVKPLAVTLVVLAVLGGAGVVADFIVRDQAEQQVAQTVQKKLGLESPPSVKLGGVPFSAALVTRKVPDASLSAQDVPLEVSGKSVSFSEVHATAKDLVLQDREVRIHSATLDAVLPYSGLSTLAGVPVEPTADGRLAVSYTAELFGDSRVAIVSAVPVLDAKGDKVRLTETSIEIAGFPLSDDIAQSIMDAVIRPIPLKLPKGVSLDGLRVEQEGLLLDASLGDVSVPLS